MASVERKRCVAHYYFDYFEAVRRVCCLAGPEDRRRAIPTRFPTTAASAGRWATKVVVHGNAVDTLAALRRATRAFWMLQRREKWEISENCFDFQSCVCLFMDPVAPRSVISNYHSLFRGVQENDPGVYNFFSASPIFLAITAFKFRFCLIERWKYEILEFPFNNAARRSKKNARNRAHPYITTVPSAIHCCGRYDNGGNKRSHRWRSKIVIDSRVFGESSPKKLRLKHVFGLCASNLRRCCCRVHLSVKREEGEEEDKIAAIDTNIIIIIIMIEKERLGYTGKRAFYWF